MNRRLFTILAVLALLATAGAGAYLGHMMGSLPVAPVHAAPEAQRVQTVNGETRVAVASDVQRASGIDVAPLVQSSVREEIAVYATIIDVQPLFDLGARLAAARADRDSVRAQSEASRAQFERSQLLYKDDRNVSLKSMQDAQTAAQSDQARLRAAEAALTVQDASLRHQFGDVLKNAAADPASGLFRRLSSGRASVLRVTVPSGVNLSPSAQITVDGPDGQRLAARKLSAAPQTETAVQGVPYFYLIDHALPTGTRTTGYMAADHKAATGLVIPGSAIVWYGGQRWAYVRVAADHFTRRLVAPDSESAEGVITKNGFRAGDKVVIRGAQLLLSEEQRPEGIATVCKDPPECDD
jgi:multidrug efflux system membrane fusion protein